MNLKNKVVVITGATKGIGKSLADSFSKEGAIVVASGKQDTDVSKEANVIALAQKVIKEHGEIDIWINNAGVFHSFSKVDDFVDMQKAHEIIDVNFFGTLFGCRTALKYIKQNEGGVIINILSSAALDATRAINAKIYAASKWAIRGYLQALKSENVDSGIVIYSVYPGGTQTDLYREKPANFGDYMTPEFVAEKVIANLKKDAPEEELVIKRPSA